MTLRAMMQAGPAKANELFTRLAETSENAVKTREKLFAELKSELEAHTDLEEQHLFPVLRKHAETRELVVGAIRDNKELRAALGELATLPKNDQTFLAKLAELRKAFRQHARDETKELLPAVQKALSEEQVQGITEKMETSLAQAEQAKHDQAEEKRETARREREQAELKAREAAAAEQERVEQAEAQARQHEAAERERQAVARRTREATMQVAEATARSVEVASESARQMTQSATENAARAVTAAATAPLTFGVPFWDMWLGMSGLQRSRSATSQNADTGFTAPIARETPSEEQVIPLAEEILTVGTRKVSSGTTRVHRYVVETPVEKQVTLVHERVVVERRKPVSDKISSETLTELTVEVIETDEVPVVGKTVRLKEEVVVRTERVERVETVRDTVRQDEVEVGHSDAMQPGRRQRAPANG